VIVTKLRPTRKSDWSNPLVKQRENGKQRKKFAPTEYVKILLVKSEGHIVVPRTCSYDDEISVRNASKFTNEPQMQRFSSRIFVCFLFCFVLFFKTENTVCVAHADSTRKESDTGHTKRNKSALAVSQSQIHLKLFYQFYIKYGVTE